MTDDDFHQVSLFLIYIGALNNVIMSGRNDEFVIKLLHLKPMKMLPSENNTNVDYVYPDHLIDLEGDTYKALAFPQRPRLYKLPNGEYHGIDIMFMKTVAEKQNANFNITKYIEIPNKARFKKIYNLEMTRQTVDMTINTAVTSLNEYTLKIFKMINTFDVNGFCALVPYPQRTSFLGQMLTPYDFYTWIMFIITIGICFFIWKMFNLMGNEREDSAFYFMYGIIAYFLLQSIPFRNNRIIQRSLLQICIFMMFILGNAYQSLIISFISESRYGATLKTFDELMQSNYSLKVDPLFYYMLNLTDDNSIKIGNVRTINSFVNIINFQQEYANNTAIVLRCDVADYIMYAGDHDTKAIDYFYLLSDHIYSYYESFSLSKFSPHHKKLQHLSTLIFESGIRQHWKEFEKYDDIRGKIETNKINNEEYLINFDDLFGVFYLLGFGFICAILKSYEEFK